MPSQSPEHAAFAKYLSRGDVALRAGDLASAYAAYEYARVLSQVSTGSHIRSHFAFLRWAWRAGDRREQRGQILRLLAAITLTWLWMPKGNTGGARVHPLHVMPIPTELRSYMETSR